MSDVTSLDTASQAGVGTGAALVTQIARICGGESENEIRSQALDCLNRVRRELNQHDWRFMKTTDDPITLVNGTATYALQSTFRKPSFAVLIDIDAQPRYTLDYLDDETGAHTDPDKTSTGLPVFYLLRNDYQDGLVTLYPTPDDSTATDFRLVVEYYARIGAFADSNESEVFVPEELANILIVGGQAYMLRERDKNSPAALQAFADYQRMKKLLLTDDRRVMDEKARFRLGTRRFQPVGTILIRA
jgi:hypothetical protein